MDVKHGFIERGKFHCNYLSKGTGVPVMILGSVVYYSRIFSSNLSDHLQLVYLDHRGFAEAMDDYDERDASLDDILDDIEFARLQLGLGKVVLMGHSGHGYMALEYAKKYPESVSHLVLIAMSPACGQDSYVLADKHFHENADQTRKHLLHDNLQTLEADIEKNPDNRFIIRMLKFGPMLWFNPAYDASALWKDVTVNAVIMDHLWGKVFPQLNIIKDIEKIQQPVWLALGRHDYFNPPFMWDDVKEAFKDFTICIFENSSHTPPLEEQKQFDEKLLTWLEMKNGVA